MMTPETFRRWRKRHGMTQEQCATELGFKDRRQIINYEKGDSEIPRYVWLATVGFDALAKPKGG
jgi:transcriptional regulator with XRE-family HTH domain